MEKYKFKVTKMEENIVEIEAKTKYEAMKKLAFYMLTNNDMFCEKVSKGNKGFYVFLNEISSETRQTIIDDYDEINEDVFRYLLSDDEETLKEYEEIFSKNDEDFEEKNSKSVTENEKNISKNCKENDDEIEDDLPQEYTEICCERCRLLHTY